MILCCVRDMDDDPPSIAREHPPLYSAGVPIDGAFK